MLSVFLVLCELFAEIFVLLLSRGQPCDRPLRFWVAVLIMLQAGTVVLNCLNIWHGRDSYSQQHHRNGLSATDLDMYMDGRSRASGGQLSPREMTSSASTEHHVNSSTVVEMPQAHPCDAHHDSSDDDEFHNSSDTQPLINAARSSGSERRLDRDETPRGAPPRSSVTGSSAAQSQRREGWTLAMLGAGASSGASAAPVVSSSSTVSSVSSVISTEFVDRYVRIVNAWYLVWFILGSVWVSDRGQCSSTAPHLYRLVVALAIIYYALLFLPLACFCLIVCCLPLFILVYRIMLPYAERERRRARAADPAQVQNLTSIVYSPETFANYTSNESVEDASCVICLCEYEPNEIIRILPCKHHFHKDCVDVWLRMDKACCLCKQDIDAQIQPMSSLV